ncbi:MAG: hypothetical protein IIZ42_00490, partial [Eubacterium sp.]|nr:hypothetical protein [Eubacterium sp.]
GVAVFCSAPTWRGFFYAGAHEKRAQMPHRGRGAALFSFAPIGAAHFKPTPMKSARKCRIAAGASPLFALRQLARHILSRRP